MSADLGARVAAISAALAQLESRQDRTTAEQVKLAGKIDSVTGRVLVLENPETAMERGHRGLEEATAKLPRYAEHLTQAQVAEQKAEKEGSGE